LSVFRREFPVPALIAVKIEEEVGKWAKADDSKYYYFIQRQEG
jgi:hypothetical protein